jgi:hypothetical protein
MTLPPLPDVPCVRVRLGWSQTDGYDAGSRFYLSYSGGAPSGADCVTLATGIATAYGADVAGNIADTFTLTEVDVLDIATHSGAGGTFVADVPGANSGTALVAQAAMNVEFDITRRYRGGKPRIFLPPGVTGDTANSALWTSGFLTSTNSAVLAMFTAIEALSVGSMGTLQHVNLSYYHGFTNITNSSGRTRAVPTYRATALHDNVIGYAAKQEIGSQRKRRKATTY